MNLIQEANKYFGTEIDTIEELKNEFYDLFYNDEESLQLWRFLSYLERVDE